MDLICVTHLPNLELYTKAILINALLKFGLRAHHNAQQWATTLFLSVTGADVTALKNILDNYSEFYSLHYLVYHGLVDPKLQQKVVAHIAQNKVYPELRHSPASLKPIKIVSDIDDTLASSGGAFPAGVDFRFPKHTIYPGVLAFYRELDLGASSDGLCEADRLGNMVFLSARPHIYKDSSEEQSYKRFRKLRELAHGLHANPVLLAGDLKGFSITWGNMEPIVAKKYENFVEYAALYPEYNFVLVGDNGQGDAALALRAIRSHGTRVKAAFIHRVRPRKLTYGFDPAAPEAERVYFFATYVGAALWAWQAQLIHRKGVLRVIDSARRDMHALSSALSATTWNERISELNTEIAEAAKELKETIAPITRGDEPVGFIQ